MGKTPSTVGIAAGAGLVARFGTAVVYLAETDSAELVLDAVEAEADGEYPGAAIARRLAGVVFGGGTEPPAFGVVAPTEDGTVILLRGKVFAQILGAEGPRSLSGARAFTWVDEIVREPVRRIRVGDDNGEPLPVHPATDLRAGIVTGSGFELRVGVRRAETPGDRAESAGAAAAISSPSPSRAGGGSPASAVPVATASSPAASATRPAAGSATAPRAAASNGSAADDRAAAVPESAFAAKKSATPEPGRPRPRVESSGAASARGSAGLADRASSSEHQKPDVTTASGRPAPAPAVTDSATTSAPGPATPSSATPSSATPGPTATAPEDPSSAASRSAVGPTGTAAADIPSSGSSPSAGKSAASMSPASEDPDTAPEAPSIAEPSIAAPSTAKPDSAESTPGEAKAAHAKAVATRSSAATATDGAVTGKTGAEAESPAAAATDSATPRSLRAFGSATGARSSATPGTSAATPMRPAPASDPSAWLTTPDSGGSADTPADEQTATEARTDAKQRGADTGAASNADTAGLGARPVVPGRSTPASNTGSRPIAAPTVGSAQPTGSGSRASAPGSEIRPGSLAASGGTGPTAADARWSLASGSDSSAKDLGSGRSGSTGNSPAADSDERPATAGPSEPAPAEPPGPRTADLPATAPAGFDALAADHSRGRDTGRRPATPSPLGWSEAEEPARPDFFASRPGMHQAPASVPGSNFTGSHPSGPNQWGRVVPLRPQTPPEPPGALVFEDVIYPLDRAYVIGRNPSGDEAVRSGTAAPLTLPRDRHVSRVHAYVTLDNGVVYVRDAGTSGGTYIAAPGTEQWTRVGDTAVELAPGWRMRLGQKILTHRPPTRPLAAYPRRY